MRINARRISGLAVVVCVVGLAAADVPGAPPQNPYRVILSHNAFNLRPIAKMEPMVPPAPPPVPTIKVFLTGIVTFSRPKVFLQLEDPQTKKTEFLPPLAVGERYKTITVLAIDPLNQTVRIKNDNAEDVLDFLNDGLKPKAVATVPPAPVPPPPRTVPVPVPPPPFVPATGTPRTRGSIVTGGETTYTQPNYANGAARRTGAVMTRQQVEARLALERGIRQRNNDPTYKLLPAIH
jgi:hypothetical protein